MMTLIVINPDHEKFSVLYNTVAATFFPYLHSCRRIRLNLGGITPKKSSQATLREYH